TRFGVANSYLYYSPGDMDWDATLALDPVAERTLATRSWRDEVDRWYEDERPRVFAQNEALQRERLDGCSDAYLAAHIERAIAHFLEVAPLHFEHSGFDIAMGLLLRATSEWEIDAADVIALLAGASPSTAAISAQVDAIVRHRDAPPTSLADIGAQDLSRVLDEHGWRVIDGNDLAGATLGERPELVLAAIRARMESGPSSVGGGIERVRSHVPSAQRVQFAELLADARGLYSLRDDDNGVCFVWPLGLIRRGVLEAGRRLADRGAVRAADDLFEATPEEISALLVGDGPRADDLAARRAARISARDLEPPMQLGELHEDQGPALPPHVAELDAIRNVYFAAASGRSAGQLKGIGVGESVVRGRARRLVDDNAVARIDVGDVLIAVTTTCSLNSVFPLLAGVATEEGGLFSHTALLARELGLPAVVGAPGLLASISDGDLVEIDAVAGVVRVIERA
ncbi:MAG TPA: PEP-utilizing enzyme, partial [Acidimicrobiales bacterium]|nr:PEP-utilizing enzyme [Acidimicrobiales bacterium]